ncbi:hypothetical protein PG2048B_0326 [Bifidobacterium pseudolongum subsp. globosum]|nr:hypothetical protein PG2048B_0326 [Bifidobacterium pseudolongum subsp. globosum]RYQ56028.1 hypothetical protein PG1578B_0343 [Bifidobacterium pseudolongum subsp. globosum]RYQ71552.1 hypothetical protein PG2023B_0324 [Bifidobacterium pseudolongum subsp. globosum]RYQ78265.1 hypothetical protein PG1577B_0343 [Bifidobacterium pseudolongum subsp. globosum]
MLSLPPGRLSDPAGGFAKPPSEYSSGNCRLRQIPACIFTCRTRFTARRAPYHMQNLTPTYDERHACRRTA